MYAMQSARVICILCILLVFRICHVEAKYKIKLLSLQKCKISEESKYKNIDNILSYEMGAKKINRQITIIQVNVTILQKLGPTYFNIRGYQIQQSGVKDLFLMLKKVECTNPLAVQVVNLLTVKLDKKCIAVPGNYTGKEINLQDFSWLLTKDMIGPGKYAYDLEFWTPSGVVACASLSCDISNMK